MARTRSRGGARSGRSGRTNKAHALTPAIEFFTQPEQHIVWRALGFIVRARAELFIVTTLLVVFVHFDTDPNANPKKGIARVRERVEDALTNQTMVQLSRVRIVPKRAL